MLFKRGNDKEETERLIDEIFDAADDYRKE